MTVSIAAGEELAVSAAQANLRAFSGPGSVRVTGSPEAVDLQLVLKPDSFIRIEGFDVGFDVDSGGDVLDFSGLGYLIGADTLGVVTMPTDFETARNAPVIAFASINTNLSDANLSFEPGTRKVFLTASGNDSKVWLWEDAGDPVADGYVQSTELKVLAELIGVSELAQLHPSNFAVML